MPKTFGKLRTGVRASRRMRMSKCIHRHASRRIAAQRCWAGGVLLDPCETDLRLQETIAGSGPLFSDCYLQ